MIHMEKFSMLLVFLFLNNLSPSCAMPKANANPDLDMIIQVSQVVNGGSSGSQTMEEVAGSQGTRLSPEVEELLDAYWNWRLRDMPEYATFVGYHEYDEMLNELSLEAFQSRYEQCHSFLEQVQVLETNLTKHYDKLNIKILKDELQTCIDGYYFKGFYLPINYMEGIYVEFERLVNWMILDTGSDFNKLLSRYEALPDQVDQVIVLMVNGVNEGIVNHAIAMKSVVTKLEDMLVSDPINSTLYKPFTIFPESITQEEAELFQFRAQQIIAVEIIPGLKRLRDYVANSYVTRPNIAVTSLPNGEGFYQQLLRFHTCTTITPHEIHSIGLSEVSRIENMMAEIVSELGYNMTVPEFSAMIKNDSSFFFDIPEDLLEGFQDICFSKVPSKLNLLFKNKPNSTLLIERDESPDGVSASYVGPTYDGSRPGVFYVNTFNYDVQPIYEMVTLSVHEGSPGHDLQRCYSVESSDTPYFRRVMDTLNYGMAPSRFPTNTAYTEGWGLYTEALGFEMELVKDPYDRYGHYSDEIFRACRLVVDTGIHALGWSRQQAVDYVFLHTALSLEEVQNEIDRYITWPGQALGYKIGGLKIQELRQRAELALGTNFDIKVFHNIVLDASGPLAIIEEEIDAWILN